jgi:dihydrofolate reductase
MSTITEPQDHTGNTLRIALAYVTSLDGKIAKADNGPIRDWASKEDGLALTKLISQFEIVVLGRATYEKHRPGLHEGRLYVVLTHHADAFAKDTVPGQREFAQGTPKEVVQHYKTRGYKNMLLLTGSDTSTAFLEAGLVDELYLTIEPIIFGDGLSMVAPKVLDIHWQLDTVARLNDRGTLLAHYIIQK